MIINEWPKPRKVIYSFCEFEFHPYLGIVKFDDKKIQLTRGESCILEQLCSNWPMRFRDLTSFSNDTIKTHVCRIRRKTKTSIINSVAGFGYSINCDNIHTRDPE